MRAGRFVASFTDSAVSSLTGGLLDYLYSSVLLAVPGGVAVPAGVLATVSWLNFLTERLKRRSRPVEHESVQPGSQLD